MGNSDKRRRRGTRTHAAVWAGWLLGAASASLVFLSSPANAQTVPGTTASPPPSAGGWTTTQPGQDNTTTILRPAPPVRQPNDSAPPLAVLEAMAVLTTEGQKIDKGLVWRIYEDRGDPRATPKLVTTDRSAAPVFKLKPGRYVVNVAFGKAHLTRSVRLEPGKTVNEPFVLNAGGLKVRALQADNRSPITSGITYDIYTDERELMGERARIVSGGRPGLIMRLNAGIYHVVSRYGDANAVVSADVTVEAGKLTDMAITHRAGRATFKLVERPGGEAIANTRWSIATEDGTLIKKSAGALPSHILQEGQYVATAEYGGKSYQSSFKAESGRSVVIEIVARP